jgi:hypothetical protein
MLKVPVIEAIAGTTLRMTWVSSGVTPTSIGFALRDKDETIVSSTAGVSSGNGHYYAGLFVPNSWPWYVGESIAIIDATTYTNRALVRRQKLEAN